VNRIEGKPDQRHEGEPAKHSGGFNLCVS
jgi:hypothetical protein